MSTLKTTAIQHLNGAGPNINLSTNGNITVVGTMNVSSGINASATSPYIFNKPTPSGYQTTLLAGSAAGGIFLTSDDAIISKGCFYNNGWIATATNGNMLNFNPAGSIQYVYFTGATVGNAPSLTTVDLVHTGNFGNSKTSAGFTRLPNGVILQWGSQSVGGDREVDYSFPLAFPTGCYGFAASGDWWGTNGWMAVGGRPISASVYRLYNIVEGTLGVWWVAMGY